jgi:hypothetical protein
MQLAYDQEPDLAAPPMMYLGHRSESHNRLYTQSGVTPDDGHCLPINQSGVYVALVMGSIAHVYGAPISAGVQQAGLANSAGEITFWTTSGRAGYRGILDGCSVGSAAHIDPPRVVVKKSARTGLPLRRFAGGSARVFGNPIITEIDWRLAELAVHAREDGTEISSVSRDDFLDFLTDRSVEFRPALSILDAGTIRAVWKNAQREQVAIHFKGDGQVNYVLFHLVDGRMNRSFDRSTIQEVPGVIYKHDLWRLLINEG